jgi:23S rRNA (cytosine1962-C5)-methyltransferase
VTDVILHPGRDRSARRRHPWILSGAVARVDGEAASGAFVRVLSAEGEVLGWGHWSPASALRVRMVSFVKEAPAEDWLESRIARAVAWRRDLPLLADTDAVRLVNAEGDGLPGLVVDRYADTVVVKLTTSGMDGLRERIAEALRQTTGLACGFERADSAAARREGIAPRQGPLWGDAPEGLLEIREGGRRYRVDPVAGQKTGFYLDQRDARRLVETLAEGRRVLDLFSYTGGFAAAAARGGASEVVAVDSSSAALALAQENVRANGPDARLACVQGDAFEFVRSDARAFDLIVIDPPPLARTRRDVGKATRAYKDVLLHALRRAADGARVLAFACSHHVGPELFRKVAFGASLDAGRPVRVAGELRAPADHAVSLDHPEGAYLTGLWLES